MNVGKSQVWMFSMHTDFGCLALALSQQHLFCQFAIVKKSPYWVFLCHNSPWFYVKRRSHWHSKILNKKKMSWLLKKAVEMLRDMRDNIFLFEQSTWIQSNWHSYLFYCNRIFWMIFFSQFITVKLQLLSFSPLRSNKRANRSYHYTRNCYANMYSAS